jgi:hypothetical protein
MESTDAVVARTGVQFYLISQNDLLYVSLIDGGPWMLTGKEVLVI